MTNKSNLKIAAAFGTVPEVLPYIPELLAGMWSLGIPPDIVVELLKDHELKPDTARVLDLGCGKGANAITLARQFGFQVHGIDLYEPFIEEARKRAQELGLEGTCHFEAGDIIQTVQGSDDFDMVLLIWVGGVMGDAGESIRRIRQLVRPGGYIVIGEGYLQEGVNGDDPFLKRFDRYEILLKKLTMHGDTLVREIVIPADRLNGFYRDYISSLRKGAGKCAGEHPEHARILWDYVNSNEEICQVMENAVESGLWLLKS